MIVVFDSGVLISALAFRGTPSRALWVAGYLGSIALCDQIENEVLKALVGQKIGWPLARAQAAITGLAENSIHVDVTGTIRGACRDPKDDMILEYAVNARASFIVSGDYDLLDLIEFQGIAIVNPRTFAT